MNKLFDMVVEDSGWYAAALETLIAGGITDGVRLNAQRCEVPIIRQLCREAMAALGKVREEIPVQLALF